MIPAQGEHHGHETFDPQTSLQANKATFFFRVVSHMQTFIAGFALMHCLGT